MQIQVLLHYVSKLAEEDSQFCYRINAYQMSKNLNNAVSQHQVEDLWRYLVSESREFHGKTQPNPKQQAKKASTSASQPPQGGSPQQQPGTTKKADQQPTPKAKAKPKAKGKAKAKPRAKSEGRKKNANDDAKDENGDGQPRRGQLRNCSFYKNGTGCRNGADCPFKHGGLSPSDGQCFNCGAKGHSRENCPYPKPKEGQTKPENKEATKFYIGDDPDDDDLVDQFRDFMDTDLMNPPQFLREPAASSSTGTPFPPPPAATGSIADLRICCVRHSAVGPRSPGSVAEVKCGSSELLERSSHEDGPSAMVSKRRHFKDEDPNTLIIIDSGCNTESRPFPAEWKGKPPKDATITNVSMAGGSATAYKHGGILYFDPEEGECEPLFPLGYYAKVWGLESFITKGPDGKLQGYLKNVDHNVKFDYK